MRRRWSGPRALALLVACCAAPAIAQPYVFPQYDGAKQVDIECQRLLADVKASEQRLEQASADGGVAALRALDAMVIRYEDTLGPLNLLAGVHADKAVRDAAEACDLNYQEFSSAFLQNPRIYALLKQVQPADEIDRRYLRDQLDAFEDSGVGLPVEKQARVRALNTEVTRLAQEFERRIREDRTQLAFTAAEVKGVPAGVWKGAKRDPKGRYLLGLDYPTVGPVLEQAALAATRERMWRAFNLQGGDENLKVLSQLAQLRREYAQLFGFDSYADFVLRRRMAKGGAAVSSFLGEVQGAVRQRELADLDRLRAAKARQLRTPLAATTIQRWDVAYYTERVRAAQYTVDQEAFRRYFPPEASLKFVFALAERLFGVRFAPLQQTLWHPLARAYEVSEVATQRSLGTLFVDLYPRADKYGHAAVWPIRNVSSPAGRRPAAALVVNFDRKGLTIGELETLLHEFGHALHGLLSTTRYAGQGGSSVQLDFVEAPSQMLEDWVYDPKVLALFQTVCKACAPVPPALIARAERARHFAKGIGFARQHLFASYDLAVYGRQPQDPMALWAAMEAATPVGHVAGSKFPASFAHIATGYAAGYYGYLWSLVIAEDLRTAFEADKLDPAVGCRYRDSVLARGGELAPEDLLRQFLGRPTDSKAFFKSLAKQ
jgi:thimet oligopeptidase